MELPEILDIVLQYLKVLAWPLVVFTLALIYRKPVITLLQRLKKYSGWGQTVELGDEARTLKEQSEDVLERQTAPTVTEEAPETAPPAADAPTEQPPASDTTPPAEAPHRVWQITHSREAKRADLFNKLATLPSTDFRTASHRAISRAWKSLLMTCGALANRLDLAPTSSLNRVAYVLASRGLVDVETAQIAIRLTELYTELRETEGQGHNIYVISDFVDTAENLQVLLEQVLADLGNNQPNN